MMVDMGQADRTLRQSNDKSPILRDVIRVMNGKPTVIHSALPFSKAARIVCSEDNWGDDNIFLASVGMYD